MATKNTTDTSSADLKMFVDNEKVIAAMRELEEKFLKRKKTVSDILDENDHQYVNLVQEGGGVLGVALVGYTYVLEKMGIRFMRLAGTSAGAINTSLLTVIGRKEDEKSEKVLDYLSRKNLFDFVDGHPFAKKLISAFITNKGFIRQSIRLIKTVFISLAALVCMDVISLGLQYHYPLFSIVARVSFVLTGVLVLASAYIIIYGNYLFRRFKAHGFGINPGKNFHDWIKSIMEENDVRTISQLKKKAATVPQGLSLRGGAQVQSLQNLNPDITLITSDIITENKIEFPKMYDLFVDDPEDIECRLHPADFVRASMSIPIFFESFTITNINQNSSNIQKGWDAHFSVDLKGIPSAVRFVDGGVLSNFPINIFYNPEIETPRLPTFGIRLDDTDPAKKESGSFSLGTYVGKLFNTIRYYYDKDFLLKNNVYKKGIGVIDVHEFNWLNFGLSKKDQVDLFVKGVIAAKDFLIGEDGQSGFDWEGYKSERIKLHQILQQSDAKRVAREKISETSNA